MQSCLSVTGCLRETIPIDFCAENGSVKYTRKRFLHCVNGRKDDRSTRNDFLRYVTLGLGGSMSEDLYLHWRRANRQNSFATNEENSIRIFTLPHRNLITFNQNPQIRFSWWKTLRKISITLRFFTVNLCLRYWSYVWSKQPFSIRPSNFRCKPATMCISYPVCCECQTLDSWTLDVIYTCCTGWSIST